MWHSISARIILSVRRASTPGTTLVRLVPQERNLNRCSSNGTAGVTLKKFEGAGCAPSLCIDHPSRVAPTRHDEIRAQTCPTGYQAHWEEESGNVSGEYTM